VSIIVILTGGGEVEGAGTAGPAVGSAAAVVGEHTAGAGGGGGVPAVTEVVVCVVGAADSQAIVVGTDIVPHLCVYVC
jgi:hypothetical protein